MKITTQIVFASIFFFGAGASVNAQLPFKSTDVEGYAFRHITDRPNTDRLPRVSTNGLVTWEGWDPSTPQQRGDFEIFLSSVEEGAITEQVTNNTFVDLRPVVNEHGDLAWTQRADLNQPFTQEVFVRSNGIVTQITNDSSANTEERYPDINDNGVVVWATRTPTTNWQLASYDINSEELIDYSVRAYRPHISNSNLIEFGGSTIVDLLGNEVVDIPNARDVGYEFFRRGEINHLDQVAIEADPGTSSGNLHADFEGPRDILFWDGTELQTVYSSDVYVGRADLNSSGIIAFEGLGGLSDSQSSGDDFEIFVFNTNTGELIQLTDDDYNDQWATVLEDGSVVWQGTGNYLDSTNNLATDSDIFIATPFTTAVPEPSSLALGLLLVMTGLCRRRR